MQLPVPCPPAFCHMGTVFLSSRGCSLIRQLNPLAPSSWTSQPPELWENTFLFFINYPIFCCSITKQTKTMRNLPVYPAIFAHWSHLLLVTQLTFCLNAQHLSGQSPRLPAPSTFFNQTRNLLPLRQGPIRPPVSQFLCLRKTQIWKPHLILAQNMQHSQGVGSESSPQDFPQLL
jgi:hypothetical protein